MARLLCPSCGRTFAYAGGATATCPQCGYSSKVAGGETAGAAVAMPSYTPDLPGALPAPGGPPEETGKTSGYAIASLVLGIVSVLGGFMLLVPPILSFVFGLVAFGQIKKEGRGGRGLAIGGLVLSGLVLGGYVVTLVIFLLDEVFHVLDL